MFVDVPELDFSRYDVIVAGSGPAGTSLAKQLEKNDKSVLILETGTEYYDADVQEQYVTISGRGHYDGQHWQNHWVRAFGGTSAVWAGWCQPLSARNLANWPISRADLDSYYLEATRFLRIPPNVLSYRAPFLPGFDYLPFSLEDPLRVAEAYQEEFETSEMIHVALAATLAEIVPNADRSRVTGFTVVSLSGERRDVDLAPAQQLVLAAGGLGNAQILLNSRAGSDIGVGNEADQVGRYLMEHPHIFRCARMVVPETTQPPRPPEEFGERENAISPDDALFRRVGRYDVSFEMNGDDVNPGDNVEAYIIERLLGGQARAFNLTARAEMPPDPENRVELTASRDPAGLPLLQTTCVVSADALRSVDDHLRHLGEGLVRSDQGRLRIDNEGLYSRIRGGGHIMGTTRMGTDPGQSVVDANCRVHGYGNLYIAGSSVFTTGGSANPTLTIVALAKRLGDHLAGVA